MKIRLHRLDPPVVIVMTCLALITFFVVHYLDHRREVGDLRQKNTVQAQRALNAQQDALNRQQARLNVKFDATRRAQCVAMTFLLVHQAEPVRPVVRKAVERALATARCQRVVYRTLHPQPATTFVPRPGPTVTVTRTVTPTAPPPSRPASAPKPTPSPGCTVLMIRLGQCPTIPPLPFR